MISARRALAAIALTSLAAIPVSALVEKLHWNTLAGTGATASPRAGAAVAANGTHILLHGGDSPDGNSGTGSPDFVISASDGSWTQVTRSSGGPVARSGSVAAADGAAFYAYGGFSANGNNNGLTTAIWRGELKDDNSVDYTQLSQTNTGARGNNRRNAAMVYLPRCQDVTTNPCLVVFGGQDRLETNFFSDTRVVTNLGSTASWNSFGAAAANRPPAAIDASFDVDASGSGAVLFGGRTGASPSTATNQVFLFSSSGFPTRPETHGNIGLASNGKSARQSSTYSIYDASRVIDGDNGGRQMSSGKCAHTRTETNPWIQIDLKRSYSVSQIVLQNRVDFDPQGRIRGFEVWVSDKPDIADVLAEGFLCPNPYDSFLSTAEIPCVTAGRYVTLRIPGTGRLIQMCEIEVWAERRWTWAQLSGTEEVAANKPARPSSSAYTGGANAFRAVDGNTATTFSAGSCTHTANEVAPWWSVDLLESREIESVQIWDRSDSCCNNRLRDFEIRVGFGTRWQDAQICKTVATIGTSATYVCDRPLVGRNVFVVMPRFTGPLTLCEVKVFARKLRNVPAPRYAHAHAAARGMVFYFGGIGSDGGALDDFAVFDTVANEFRAPGSVVGVDPDSGYLSPVARSYAMMAATAGSAKEIVLLGGRATSATGEQLIDAHRVEMRSCPDMTSVDSGIDTTTCERGACYYTCKSGFSDANVVFNKPQPGVCTPQGVYLGSNNIPFCQQPPPPAPTGVTAVAGEESAVVSWTAPSTGTAVEAYRVSTVQPAFVDQFTGTALSSDWTFVGGGEQGNQIEVKDGSLIASARAGTNCWETTNTRCLRVLRKPPTTLTGSYTVEFRVKFDPSYIKDNVFGGIVFWNEAAGHHGIYVGLRRTGGVFQFNIEAAQVGYATRTVGTDILSVRVTYSDPDRLFSFFYREQDTDELGQEVPWTLAFGRLWAPNVPGGLLQDGRWSFGPMIKTWGGDAKFLWDFVSIAPGDCSRAGSQRVVPAHTTSTTVFGLQPNLQTSNPTYPYTFKVEAKAVNGGWGPAGVTSTAVAPTIKASDNWVNVARNPNAVARQSSTAYDGPASAAIDDDVVYIPPTSHYGCTHSAWENQPWWTVDLGQKEDIEYILISGRVNCCQERLWGFELWIGDSALAYNAAGNQRCPPSKVPWSWSNANNGKIPIFCGLSGRHVWIRLTGWNFLTLCGVEVFAPAKCPNDRAVGGADLRSGADCTAATSGKTCNARCPTGYSVVAGSESSTCTMGEWSDAPLRCEKVCDRLVGPAGAARCEQALFMEDFADNATALSRFIPADPINRALDNLFHAADGALVVAGDEACNPDSVLLAADDGVKGTQGRTMTRVRVHSDNRAGVVFRALNQQNMYAALLDFESFEHVVLVVQDGVVTELDRRRFAIRQLEWHTITADAYDKYVVVSVDDTVQLFNVTSVHLSTGASGVWAMGSARFDDFSVSVPCSPPADGSSVGECTRAAAGDTCAFSCRNGFEPSGDATRTCTAGAAGATNTWTGTDFNCKIRPPIVQDANRSVDENSPRGTAVGAPVPAELEADGEQMQFAITSGNVGNAFRIDLCSGLITVHNQAALDFETMPVFTLTIDVSVSGFADSNASATVWVRLQDVDEPPVLGDARFNVSEAALDGTFIGKLTGTDQEGDELNYEASFDQTEGLIRVDRATGSLALARSQLSADRAAAILNFEAGSVSGPKLLMIIDAYQVNNPALRASAFVTIDILDANDAPRVTPGQVLTIDETEAASAALPATYSMAIAATDEDAGAFASQPLFAFVVDSATGKLVGNVTSFAGKLTNALLTTDGTASGADLFALNASSGQVSIINTPNGINVWSGERSFLTSTGILARREFVFGVRVTDQPLSGASLSSAGTISAVIDANITAEPVIESAVLAFPGPVQQGVAAGLLSTAGGQVVNITGRSLVGTVSAAWISKQRTDLPGSPSRGYNLTDCVAVSVSLVQCVSPAGWGTDLDLQMVIGGARAIRGAVLRLSYAPPTIDAIDFADRLPTRGGPTPPEPPATGAAQPITIRGTNLGPTGAPVRFEFVSVTRLDAALAGSVAWQQCLGTAVTQSSVTVECTAPPGAGRDLAWRYVIDSDSVNGAAVYASETAGAASQTLLAYAGPVLTSVEISPASNGGSLSSLDTMGGEIIRLVGDNFGPLGTDTAAKLTFAYDSNVRATSPMLAAVQLPLVACSRPVPAAVHTIIDCAIPAGAGTGLVVDLTVAEQSLFGSAASTNSSAINVTGDTTDTRQRLSYAGPVIMSVSGPGATAASTRGGEQVVIRGSHFGPLSLSSTGSVESAVYGAARMPVYTATDCRVTQSIATGSPGGEQVISCLTAEGVGAGHSWQVQIASQSSPWNDAGTSYGPPIVASFGGAGALDADTRGSQAVTIQGSNFGPAALVNGLTGLAKLHVEYSVVLTDLSTAALRASQQAAAAMEAASSGGAPEDGLRVNFTAAGCSVQQDHTLIGCTTAPGAGAALSWSVTIDSQLSRSPSTNYAPPQIEAIALFADEAMTVPVARASPNGGTWALLSGNYFGPSNAQLPYVGGTTSLIQWVSVGPSGREYIPDAVRHLDHDRVLIRLPAGYGEGLVAQMAVADQESARSEASFDYARPTLVSLTPQNADTSRPLGSSVPEYVVVEAQNLPVRDPSVAIVVLFGRPSLGQAAILPTPFANKADAVAANGNQRIRFALPDHAAGIDVPVRVGVVSAALAAAAAANGSTISPASVRFESPCDSALEGAAGAPACLFRFNGPVVDSVALSRPAWAGGSNRTDAVEPCPFERPPAVTCLSKSPSTEVFRCDSGTIRRITFSGRSFGSLTADTLFGTTRCLELDTRSALGLGGQLFSAADAFVSRWDDNRVVAYIDFSSGKVRMTVRTPEDNAGVEQLQQVVQDFTTESPSIARREGAFEDIPTAGGRVLTLYAPELDKFASVQVHVASTLANPAPLELLDLDGQYKAMALDHTRFATVLELGEVLYVVRFRAPPGHGTGVRVILRGNTAGSPVDSDTAAELSYLAPKLTGVDIGVVDPVTGAMPWSPVPDDVGRFTVRAPTLGTFVRLRGENFGPCAKAFVGAGAQFGTFLGASTAFCSATPAVNTEGFNASWPSPVASRAFDRITACDAADGSEHECIIVPVPPGQGTGVGASSGSTGFQIQLSAADRTPSDPSLGASDTRIVLLRYLPPTVLSIARSGAAAALPTRGGVPITIRGSNFGELPPLGDPASTALAVRIGRRDRSSGSTEAPFLWALDCASPQRMGHTMIQCTLPEGAGEALDVEVRVAGQGSSSAGTATLSYSPPYVGALILKYNDTHEECVRTAAAASMPMAPGGAMPWPAACAAAVSDSAASPGALRLANIPAAGGVNVTVLGENFARRGLRVPLCVFATWQGAASQLVCDDDGTDRVESFVGEGQLPPSAVFEHDHNMIKFQLPAGVGARRLDVLVGGARLSTGASARRERRSLATADATRPLLLAARPRVDLISPVLGTTRGGTEVLISGMHFGPDKALFNASVGGSALDGNRFVDPANSAVPRPISAALAVAAPTHYMIVHFGRLCVSNSALVPQSLGCSIGGVVSHADNGIVFRSPSGVGVNKAVRVEIVDAADASRRYPSAGPGVMFSYNPPRVITANPRTIMMRGDGARKRVEILGDDFGGVPPDPCTAQTCWTDEEKELSLQIGAVHCVDSAGNPSATRKIEQGTTAVLCDLEPQLVGAKNLTLRIAGQSDFVTKQDVFRAVQMVCGSGAFGRPGESCMACPLGANCDGYVAELVPENSTLNAITLGLGPDDEDPTPHTYPRPLTGFYNLNSSDSLSSGMLADCPASNRIGSRDVCIVRCDPPGACVGDNFCGVGYASTPRYNFRCNDCAQGYYRRNNGNCDECPQDVALLIAVFIMVVIVASVLAYYLASKNIALFLPTVALDYFQILALFANSRATWPPFISDLLDFFSAFLLDLNITAPECIAPNLGFTFRYGVTMALPIAAAALFGTMFVVNYLWSRIIKRQTRTAACAAADTLIAMGLTGGYVLYVQLARTMFASLACSPNNPPEFDEAGNVIEYLQVVPEPCSKPGGVHQTLLPLTVIGLLVYIAGYPAFVAYKLISNRRLVVEDQLLRCKGVGDSESTNPHALHMRKRYSRIYYAFAPNFAPYWLHVLLMRKLLLAATALVFVRTPSWQLTLGLLVLFVAYAMQVRYRPWLAASDREKHLTAHRVRALTPGSIDNKIASTIANAEHGLRKRSTFGSGLDASSARARAMQIGTVIYGSVLNNPNTFDSVLLTCGILVAIGGLLFESDRFASELPFYDSQRDSLAVVVGAVIIFGVIYAVVVIGLEFAALIRNSSLTQSQRAREAAKKAKDSKGKGEDSAGATSAVVGSSAKSGDIGDVDLMNNPMMMQKSDETDGRGLVVHTDAAADAIASITGKPDEQTWAIFKDAFLKLRAQVGELTRSNIEMERRYESTGATGARPGSTAAALAGSAVRPSRKQFSQVRTSDAAGAAAPDETSGLRKASLGSAGSMRGLGRGDSSRSRSRSRALMGAKKKGAAVPIASAVGAGAGAGAASTSGIANPLMSAKPGGSAPEL